MHPMSMHPISSNIFMDLKAHIDSNTVAMRDCNTALSPIHGSSKQKINKEISELNHIIDQMHIADVYRIFLPTSTEYTFSAFYETFSKIDHILGHKASLSKYKKIEIIPCTLSDDNALKLELNNKNNRRKYADN
jgi:hypothetical protein